LMPKDGGTFDIQPLLCNLVRQISCMYGLHLTKEIC